MNKHPRHAMGCFMAGVLLAALLRSVCAQDSNQALRVFQTASNLVVAWPGQITLQSAAAPGGSWQDVLEAGNPLPVSPTNAQQFYRAITRWSTRANLLVANSEMGVAELNGKIYVLGGYPSSRVTSPTVQVYDAVSNTWQLSTPMPVALNHLMPAVVNGKLYVIGGQTDDGNTSFTNTVLEFNPATTNWSFKAPMPTARSAGAAAVIGDLIYVAGGRPPRGQDFAVYHTVSNTWQTLTNMPTGRNHLAATAINGKVYVAGGRLGAGFTSQMTAVLEIFDPSTGLWSNGASLPIPRGGVNGIAANGNFFVFGGEGPSGMFDDMDMYVPSLNRWYRLESLPTAVHGVTGAAFVNGWIHLPGGGTSTGGSSGSTIHQVFRVGGIGP